MKTVHLPTTSYHTRLVSYVVGFGLSLLTTFDAYLLVTRGLLHGKGLVMSLAALAITQLVVQLLCFLHLGKEPKDRLRLWSLLFAALVVMIVVFGSIWIMDNLNYHMDSNAANTHIIQDEGVQY
jgi:cytochrome o ubiquinol oxidase operon protein cyoD